MCYITFIIHNSKIFISYRETGHDPANYLIMTTYFCTSYDLDAMDNINNYNNKLCYWV